MTIIESLKDFISTCPYLDKFSKGINVNYLGENEGSYCIESVPGEPILRQYLDGSCLMQFPFIFCSKESYGQDVFTNIDKSGFYESFSEWIMQENQKGNLPNLGENRKAQKIEVTTLGYPYQTEVDKARYQIQLRLIYMMEG